MWLKCFLSLQAYSTVSTDHARFNDRVAELKARPKTEWVPKPWPPKSKSPTCRSSAAGLFAIKPD